MNRQQVSSLDTLSQVFHALGQPARLRILLALGGGEACVCHLEAALGYRQAYLSQQLTVLRDAGLVNSRRAGKHIYYAITSSQVIDILRVAGAVENCPEELSLGLATGPFPGCACPHCQAQSGSSNPTRTEPLEVHAPSR